MSVFKRVTCYTWSLKRIPIGGRRIERVKRIKRSLVWYLVKPSSTSTLIYISSLLLLKNIFVSFFFNIIGWIINIQRMNLILSGENPWSRLSPVTNQPYAVRRNPARCCARERIQRRRNGTSSGRTTTTTGIHITQRLPSTVDMEGIIRKMSVRRSPRSLFANQIFTFPRLWQRGGAHVWGSRVILSEGESQETNSPNRASKHWPTRAEAEVDARQRTFCSGNSS